MKDKILNFVKQIDSLISNQEFLEKYLSDNNKVFKVKSSLYVLQDTQLVINLYLSKNLIKISKLSNWLEKKSLSYLIVYGFLQSLYIQQNAIKSLCKALNICEKSIINGNPKLRNIRNIRNHTIGHPSDRHDKGESFLSQQTVNQYSFKYTEFKNDSTNIIDVDIKKLAKQQIFEIEQIIDKIYQELSIMEKKI